MTNSRSLDLRTHYFLIGLDQFVAHLKHHLKRDIRLFHSDYGLVELDRAASGDSHGCLVCVSLELVEVA
jgi:hypothetical protein